MLLPLSLLSVFYLLAVIAVCWKKSDLGFWAICISAPLVFILVIGFWPLLSTNGTQPTAESLNDKAKSNRSTNRCVPIQKILQKKQKAVRRRTPLIKQVLNPIAPLSGLQMDISKASLAGNVTQVTTSHGTTPTTAR